MSEFSGGTRVEAPSLYGESKMLHEYSTMTDEVLLEKAQYYSALSKTDLMPRARQQINRILDHLEFEIKYRSGAYE